MRNGDRGVVPVVSQFEPNLSPALESSDAIHKAGYGSLSKVLVILVDDVFDASLLVVLDSHGYRSGWWLGRRDRAAIEPLEDQLRRRADGLQTCAARHAVIDQLGPLLSAGPTESVGHRYG